MKERAVFIAYILLIIVLVFGQILWTRLIALVLLITLALIYAHNRRS